MIGFISFIVAGLVFLVLLRLSNDIPRQLLAPHVEPFWIAFGMLLLAVVDLVVAWMAYRFFYDALSACAS